MFFNKMLTWFFLAVLSTTVFATPCESVFDEIMVSIGAGDYQKAAELLQQIKGKMTIGEIENIVAEVNKKHGITAEQMFQPRTPGTQVKGFMFENAEYYVAHPSELAPLMEGLVEAKINITDMVNNIENSLLLGPDKYSHSSSIIASTLVKSGIPKNVALRMIVSQPAIIGIFNAARDPNGMVSKIFGSNAFSLKEQLDAWAEAEIKLAQRSSSSASVYDKQTNTFGGMKLEQIAANIERVASDKDSYIAILTEQYDAFFFNVFVLNQTPRSKEIFNFFSANPYTFPYFYHWVVNKNPAKMRAIELAWLHSLVYQYKMLPKEANKFMDEFRGIVMTYGFERMATMPQEASGAWAIAYTGTELDPRN